MLEELEKKSARRFDRLLLSEKPLGIRFLNWILGPSAPGIYTKITFFIALLIWFIFILWNGISLIALKLGNFIFDKKSVDINALIQQRGNELGFEPSLLLDRLITYHSIAIICWGIVLVSLILLWRKNSKAVYFFFGGTIGYLFNMWFLLGFDYYLDDTTSFDKISYCLLFGQTAIYFIVSNWKTKESE